MLHLSARRVGFALVLAVSAYAWWVGAQYGRLNALNQLEVQDASAELKRVVENAVDTVSNLNLTSAGASTRSSKPAGCLFDEQQPYLDFLVALDCTRPFHYKNAKLVTGNGLLIQAEEAQPHIDTTGKEKAPAPVLWRVRLDTLFAELAFSDAFELIFVADEDGKVLYQATPRHREWRPLLRWGERTFEDSGAREAGGLRIQDIGSLLGKNADPGWARLHAVSDRTTVTLAGDSHQLYVEPVAGSNGINARLVLGALVPTQGILRRALAVDTFAVALLVVVFVLAVLGLPFLKLAAMSAHERLRGRDVYGLYVSCAALVMVGTFIVLGYDTHLRWTREADEGLVRFADDLSARVDAEVRAIRDQLVRYDAEVSWYYPASPCNSTKVIQSWPDADPASDPDGRVLRRNTSVFIDQVSWIAPDGKQVWKITSDRVSVLRSVAQRPYFKAVRAGHLYSDTPSAASFFVAPDRSITDGRFYTFLSIHSAMDDACASVVRRDPTGEKTASTTGFVAVASTRLLSLEQPALPLGYGFAIVTRDGRSLYHSDPRLGLRENLFDHLDEQDLARAIVQSGAKASLSARYRAVPHQLRFNPLPWSLDVDRGAPSQVPDESLADASAGLTLVAFRDMSTEQALIARVFVVAVGPMLVVVSVLGLAVWVLGAASERRKGSLLRWLWPHGGLASTYKIVAVSIAAILVLFFATTQLVTRVWPFLLLPAFAAAPTFAVSRRGAWLAVRRRALDGYGWYATELMLLAVAMLIVPASAVLNLALGHEFGVLLQAEQKRMDAQSIDAALTLKDEARTLLYYSDHVADEIAGAHEARQRQLLPMPSASRLRPAPFNANLEPVKSGDQSLIGLHDWFNDSLPAESALLARLRYHDVPSRYTPRGSLGALSWFGAIGITVIIIVLAAWIRWSARHLHAADITPGEAIADDQIEARWNDLSDDQRHVLLQAAEERIANPRQLPTIAALAQAGFLKLSPDIQPASDAVADWLERVRADLEQAEKLRRWEHTHNGHSWQAMRPIIFAGLGIIAIFLAIAEPSLQSEVVGVTGSVATLAGALLKLRDTVGGWIGAKAVEAK